ncbi:MAG: UpxY family transcription antiterminator [Deltaproteobacteria bacterium]|nr:UpxY family transcription antiterminator [Deltaproteobacteria bacterium]
MSHIAKRLWYAVHVRSNQERATGRFLMGRAVEIFLPTYRVRVRRTDRRVEVTRPLFPGYLFVHVDLAAAERVEVLKAPGTVRIVGFGEGPVPVPDDVIHSLGILVGAGQDTVKPHPLVRTGQRVEVTDGPFAGAVGVIAQTGGRKPRLVVEVEFLGRAVAVPIGPEEVRPLLGSGS